MRSLLWALAGLATAVAVVAGCDAVCSSSSQLAPGTYLPSSAPVGLDGYSLVVDGDYYEVHEQFSVDGHAHARTWRVPVVHHYDTSN